MLDFYLWKCFSKCLLACVLFLVLSVALPYWKPLSCMKIVAYFCFEVVSLPVHTEIFHNRRLKEIALFKAVTFVNRCTCKLCKHSLLEGPEVISLRDAHFCAPVTSFSSHMKVRLIFILNICVKTVIFCNFRKLYRW